MSSETRGVVVQRDDYEITLKGKSIVDARYMATISGSQSLATTPSFQTGITRDLMKLGNSAEVFNGNTFLGNASWEATGLPGSLNDIDGVELTHLHVQDDARGRGIGSILFDWYRAAAIYQGGTANGAFGGGTASVEFLESQGVPADEIRTGGGAFIATSSVHWSVPADELMDSGVMLL